MQPNNTTSLQALCKRSRPVTDVPNVRPCQTLEHRFLRLDYTPSDIEKSQLENMLKEGEQKVEQCEEIMAVLRKRLEQMESTQNAVETTNAQCRAALSAQRRVPVEIWQMIFSTLCLTPCHPHFPSLRKIIAKGMPSIWSTISFHLSESLHDVNVSTPLKVYLSNSETSLLKMRFTSSHSAYLCPRILQAWETLSRHIHRGKEFVMWIDSSQDNYHLPPIPDLTFPYLEFYRGVRLSHDELRWPWFRRALREAPKLTTVTIRSPSLHHCDLPFSQLTTWRVLRITSDSGLSQFFEFARACGHLKNLTLEILSYSVPPRELREVELPSLQKLSLTSYVYDIRWLYGVLASLVIPSLKECNIQCRDWPGSSFLDMVRRSSSSLKRMRLAVLQTLTSSPCSPLFDVLQAASELTQFGFVMGRADNDHPTYLTRMANDMISTLLNRLQNDPNTFLPKLNLLSLEFSHVTPNTQLVERVLGVVSARQLTLYPLKEFRLRVVRPVVGKKVGGEFVIGPELLERIRVLNEGQIKVAFEDCFEER
ncbi:hypothetical protein E1B28_006972 [Marasmius oreades]|uniref:Uncharacterized protein n=1 Tax=Marasmius oreades TaxID=181124 RepID=A0A9P7UTK0_9AGAR|nr:uncharacterized protein E1B28_006972 [Marasmius oreades]KAG7093290.1 hypothetical protein E1B28_006972 [Marasmius oreades]